MFADQLLLIFSFDLFSISVILDLSVKIRAISVISGKVWVLPLFKLDTKY